MRMSYWWYSFYLMILGIIAFFTGEIVTYAMLGIILVSLNNINTTLKRIYHLHKKQIDGSEQSNEQGEI